MIEIVRYDGSYRDVWNGFVRTSKNGTFLFERDYMDYHADRFADHSLLFYQDSRLIALLPANVSEGVFYSHQGLTYGGLVLGLRNTAAQVLELVQALLRYLQQQGFVRLVYKCVPHIYHRYPAEEDLYALWRSGAVLSRRSIATVVPGEQPLRFGETRRQQVQKALKQGYKIFPDNHFDAFWPVLEQNLQERYAARPVHRLDEIKRLHERFPENIRLYRVCDAAGATVAGTVLYLTGRVVHSQYISSTAAGKQYGAVDYLYDYLLHEAYAGVAWFDLGTSVEQGGLVLNEGLIFHKERMGGRAVMYDTYEINW
ncbi:MAG: GNAT family N-acetyltransferase [Coprobacter sp.]|nr:GNAT family N-acetyltransferase [Coprobacter sp.]